MNDVFLDNNVALGDKDFSHPEDEDFGDIIPEFEGENYKNFTKNVGGDFENYLYLL